MINLAKTKSRAAIESLYTGRCDVIEHRKVNNADGSTSFKDVPVVEGQPCRLSFSRTTGSDVTSEHAAAVSQSIKVFIAPELVIKPGSKLVITQNGITTAYMSSGFPAYYSSHQEIELELFERWA